MRPVDTPAVTESLALLLLPAALEDFDLSDHARRLLAIPRVVALEPSRFRTPRWLRDTIPARQVRRLRLPGEPRLIVLYGPGQYPLARGLCARYGGAEIWYLPAPERVAPELLELDQLARQRATKTTDIGEPDRLAAVEEELRLRFRELEIISHRPFVPDARIG